MHRVGGPSVPTRAFLRGGQGSQSEKEVCCWEQGRDMLLLEGTTGQGMWTLPAPRIQEVDSLLGPPEESSLATP